MVQLFHASSALRQEFHLSQEATEAATAGADIFVDTAAEAPLCQARHPADLFSTDRAAGRRGDRAMKRWVLPALCSAALHLLLLALLLFAPDLERTRPGWGVTENRVITLALVEMPTIGTAAPAPAPHPPDPMARPKRRAAVKPSIATAAKRSATERSWPGREARSLPVTKNAWRASSSRPAGSRRPCQSAARM